MISEGQEMKRLEGKGLSIGVVRPLCCIWHCADPGEAITECLRKLDALHVDG